MARPKESLGLDGVLSVGEMPGGAPNFRGTPSLAGMREWLQLLGYSVTWQLFERMCMKR